MLISNIETLPGTRIVKHLGIVQGSTVRAKHVGKDFLSSIKNIFGGELSAYTELLEESRHEAIQRMKQQAAEKGANAVLNVRFSTSTISAGAAEILAYGTAVVLQVPNQSTAQSTQNTAPATAQSQSEQPLRSSANNPIDMA